MPNLVELSKWFWRKCQKCKKFTYRGTDGRRTKRSGISTSFSEGELNTFNDRYFKLLLMIMIKR